MRRKLGLDANTDLEECFFAQALAALVFDSASWNDTIATLSMPRHIFMLCYLRRYVARAAYVPREGGADLAAQGLPLLPVCPGDALLPLLLLPLLLFLQLQSQSVLPFHSACQTSYKGQKAELEH